MGFYDEHSETSNSIRQRDIVLMPNEYCFVQTKTNGAIKTYTGPTSLTISQQEALVIFDTKTKQFKEVTNPDHAKQIFISAPENWYVILKNPTAENIYPEAGKPMVGPALEVGRKINVKGPISFSLFPGQMAKAVRGHALRSNQYLLARVYEAEAASQSTGEMLDSEGNKVEKTETYVNGQILVIKGTEVSFYIPPTGIEVIPIDNDPNKGYVREAITLERLEYCILKDEDGNKRYVHGPKVVFPKPTETFVASSKSNYIFRAIELSPISGLYVKVIAEYTDEAGIVHPVGEELFITGNDQMIYYPRPEHAIINYDNKIMHHAIAIPEGEGRYIMNRLTGEINTVKGPKMYLPDPRTEVVVKRKLTDKQCRLWYPGNAAALEYNQSLTEKSVEKSLGKDLDALTAFCSYINTDSTLANLEAKANISRGTSYTKPRTITLDNKFEGVVSLDVWTGYAVNIISKNGDRKVVLGPQTVLLDYDQTLEELSMSTGKPKSTYNLLNTVFLRHKNNKVSDLITVETKDFVQATVKVSYCVNFDEADQDKWFAVENYVKYLCDRERALLKRAAKDYSIEEFYQNYSTIVRNVAIDADRELADGDKGGRYFPENGMRVYDCEVLAIQVDSEIEEIILDHQHDIIRQNIALADAQKSIEIAEKRTAADMKKIELDTKTNKARLLAQEKEAKEKLDIQARINRAKEAEEKAASQARADIQKLLDTVQDAELARSKKEHADKLAQKTDYDNLEIAKQQAYAETIKEIMSSISPDFIAAITSKSNAELLEIVAGSMSPYAIANGESVVDTTNKLIRGTGLEEVIKGVNLNLNKKD